MIDASHSPVDGCSAPIVTPAHPRVGRTSCRTLEHLLLALERLEQSAERLAPPVLRLVGQVRDPADDHVRGALALGRRSGASRPRAAAGRARSREPRPRASTGAPGPRRRSRPRRDCSRSSGDREHVGVRRRSGRSITRLSTRPCWPTARIITVGPMSISSRRTSGSSAAPGGTARPAYCVSATEQLHGSLQHLLEVDDRLGEVAGDRAALRVAEASAVRAACRRSGGSPVSVGMRPALVCGWVRIAELLEGRHLVADRGARDAEAGAARRSSRSRRARRSGRTPRPPRGAPRICGVRIRTIGHEVHDT